MPEIALTGQFLDRFAKRFGVRPAEWHSGVSARKRARIWAGVASGEVQAVAGARSALFLPYADLGAVIVDEEHEQAYKQEDGVAYHARDMAVVRARLEKCRRGFGVGDAGTRNQGQCGAGALSLFETRSAVWRPQPAAAPGHRHEVGRAAARRNGFRPVSPPRWIKCWSAANRCCCSSAGAAMRH